MSSKLRFGGYRLNLCNNRANAVEVFGTRLARAHSQGKVREEDTPSPAQTAQVTRPRLVGYLLGWVDWG